MFLQRDNDVHFWTNPATPRSDQPVLLRMDHLVKTFPGVVALDVYSKKQGKRSVIGMFMNANNRNQAAVATETAPATAEVDAAHPGHRSSRGGALPQRHPGACGADLHW